MDKIYLSLGSNIGNKVQQLSDAVARINETAGTVVQISPCYETAAWGPITQDTFINCIVEISSKLLPSKLLQELLNIEQMLGRKRLEKYGPRTIDIDILLIDDKIIDQKKLTVPHPLLQDRRFVLAPLNDIAPHHLHPILKSSITALLADCKDAGNVNKLKTTISL